MQVFGRATITNIKKKKHMNNTPTQDSIFVGVDVHKYSHSAVALNLFGQEKGKLEFTNSTLSEYTKWLYSLGNKNDIIVGLEDTNCYGIHMVEALRKEAFHIRYVPAILTERERKASTTRHKSDYADATRVGKVILTKYEETLPAKESIANEDELKVARELDLLLMERRDLVKEKTILKNQLHALIHQQYGDAYRTIVPRSFGKKTIQWFLNDLGDNATILARGIVRRLERLLFVEHQIYEMGKEVEKIGQRSCAALLLQENLHGCGMMTACAIVSELVTIRRFKTKHTLSMYAGVAPVEHSSGRKRKLHTNPFGNRRLNRAVHTIALCQIAIKGDPQGKIYYQKKLKEGKTKLWALRCLKHQIAKAVFTILRRAATYPTDTKENEAQNCPR